MMPPLYVVTQQRGRSHRPLAEARGEPIDDGPQPVAAHRDGVEERQLSPIARSEPRGQTPDETNRLGRSFPLQQRRRPAVELEAVTGGIAGVAAGERAEISEAELEGHPRRRKLLSSQLAGDSLGVTAQGAPELFWITAVDA